MTTTTPLASLSTDALDLLTAWEPTDELGAQNRTIAIDFITRNPGAVSRTSDCGGHVTVSVVLIDAGHRALLTLHPKFGRWFQLGGHLEVDDVTIAGAALREATEESGLTDIDLDPALLDVGIFYGVPCPAGTANTHVDLRFVARARGSLQHVRSAESTDLSWWPLYDLPTPHDGDLLRMADLTLARTLRAR